MKTHTTFEFSDIAVGELFVYEEEAFLKLNDSDKNNAICVYDGSEYPVDQEMDDRVISIRGDEDVNSDEYESPDTILDEARTACRKRLEELDMEAILLRRLFGNMSMASAPPSENVG